MAPDWNKPFTYLRGHTLQCPTCSHMTRIRIESGSEYLSHRCGGCGRLIEMRTLGPFDEELAKQSYREEYLSGA